MKNSPVVDELKQQFNQCLAFLQKYSLKTEDVEKQLNSMGDFRVTTPIIGGFSTGKSSMINAVLGVKLLRTEITPETAVAAEICHGNNKVMLWESGASRTISVEEYQNFELNAEKTELVQIQLENNFLQQVPDVMMVDMPGFDSGIELHNKAIDAYLPRSLAYVLTFSADEPVVKESIANFLRELKLHQVPVYLVITKCDKVTAASIEESKKFLRSNIHNLLGVEPLRVACVKSKRKIDVQEVQAIFMELQKKSEDIFVSTYKAKLAQTTALLEKYFTSRLNHAQLSTSELEGKEKELEKSISDLYEKLAQEEKLFGGQLKKCIDAIKTKISAELTASSQTIETMLLNQHDIKDKINLIVRNAVLAGIKSEFEPKLQRYLRHVTDLIDIPVTVSEVKLDGLTVAADHAMKNIIVKSIPVVLAAIGGILAGPIGAVVSGALAILVESFFHSKKERQQNELVRQKVHGEIIPQIVDEAGKCVETELNEYVSEINASIFEDVEKQGSVLRKALEDVKSAKKEEELQRMTQIQEISVDLETIRSIVNG